MTDFRQRPETPGFEVDDEMDLLFGRANPNPNREGCLPVDALKSLALRERRINDPGFEHLAQCSPCFREFRGFQQANARVKAAARRTRYQLAAAAVAALLVGAAGSWVWLQRESGPPTPGSASAAVARLDLRPFSVTRGTEVRAEPNPLVLPRGLVSATILLPVGAEPGDYELRVVDENQSVLASATGSAAIRDRVTTLETTIDAALRPGSYQLQVRRVGNEWQSFPVRIE